MASIKPIESSSVHRIQSGQVIVDLCSVVKELVENSIDAGATSVEIRFKNNGLDAIEVSDNGSGIAKEDFESVGLKHHTSKLRSYDDLSELDTFGFRGEALSSLCALSDVHIVTSQEHEAPKAARLDFEPSGALKGTSTQAAQRGTTVYIETIFKNLPVRRQELTKNIKREYQKVLGLLQAYACISTKARISVSNIAAKGKKTIQFATKAGQTTRENIANIYGTQTTAVLIPLDLELAMQPTSSSLKQRSKQVRIVGHVSRPTVGEGRQTPDRQMFFVNGRPCVLPQVAKAMNEVYKTYNLSQSPFIFADVQLDTNAYDVNVSPDKRTILLHEQGELLDSLREALTDLFDNQRQSVPQAKTNHTPGKLPAFSPLSLTKASPAWTVEKPGEKDVEAYVDIEASTNEASKAADEPAADGNERASGHTSRDGQGLIQKLFTHKVHDRPNPPFKKPQVEQGPDSTSKLVANTVLSSGTDLTEDRTANLRNDGPLFVESEDRSGEVPFSDHSSFAGLRRTQADNIVSLNGSPAKAATMHTSVSLPSPEKSLEATPMAEVVGKSNEPVREEEPIRSLHPSPVKATPGPVPNAFDRMRPLRTPAQKATITIGDQTTTTTIGSSQRQWTLQTETTKSKARKMPNSAAKSSFQSSLRAFAAPGSQTRKETIYDIEDSDGERQVDDTPMPARRLLNQFTPGPAKMTNRGDEAQCDSETNDDDEDNGDDVDAAEESPGSEAQAQDSTDDDSDGEYLDDKAKKEREDARVAKLIQEAEERAAKPTDEGSKKAGRLLKAGHRAATTRLLLTIPQSLEQILDQCKKAPPVGLDRRGSGQRAGSTQQENESTAEERLALTVSKEDFGRMRIAGQFNLGFIIALRPSLSTGAGTDASHLNEELFIIDQHASDEKYNFERLQATTVVQNQPLVYQQRLDLTAIEEEIIIENQDTLQKNGFEVKVDESGDSPVGKRCTVLRLPMSKEVTFSTRDLEELIALLAESPPTQTQAAGTSQRSLSLTAPTGQASSFLAPIVRPSAVRKMFAMRACRSSVMIGKTLSHRQMRGLVTNMGQMEKPWNCPHGRPTMRHLYSFGQWRGWTEADGVSGMVEDDDFMDSNSSSESGVDWTGWLGHGSSQVEETSSSQEVDESENLAETNDTVTQQEVDMDEDEEEDEDEGEDASKVDSDLDKG